MKKREKKIIIKKERERKKERESEREGEGRDGERQERVDRLLKDFEVKEVIKLT